MNKEKLVKLLALVGKIAAGAGALSGLLSPEVAAIVFGASSILKDVVQRVTELLTSTPEVKKPE